MNCYVYVLIFSLSSLIDVSLSAGQTPISIADKIELMAPTITNVHRSNQESLPTRSPLLDSLFNIPIQTLKAVNDLVQGIASNLQTAGVPNRPVRNPTKIKRHSERVERKAHLYLK